MLTLMPYFRRDGLQRKRTNDIFDDFLNDRFFGNIFPEGETFKADIKEIDDSYIVQAELPGVAKENIDVALDEGILTIKAERKNEINEEKDNFIRREMRYGSFERSFRVEDVKADEIKAEHKDGILEITLPKDIHIKEKAKKIEVA